MGRGDHFCSVPFNGKGGGGGIFISLLVLCTNDKNIKKCCNFNAYNDINDACTVMTLLSDMI